jgi:hypothetical protein
MRHVVCVGKKGRWNAVVFPLCHYATCCFVWGERVGGMLQYSLRKPRSACGCRRAARPTETLLRRWWVAGCRARAACRCMRTLGVRARAAAPRRGAGRSSRRVRWATGRWRVSRALLALQQGWSHRLRGARMSPLQKAQALMWQLRMWVRVRRRPHRVYSWE